MRPFIQGILALVGGLAAAPALAAELVMVEQAYCEWCERWDAEIGVVYHKTDEGRRAPLRKIDIASPALEEIALTSHPNFTPTFILIEAGAEVGRIEGYPGEDFFWPMLGLLLDKLPENGGSGS